MNTSNKHVNYIQLIEKKWTVSIILSLFDSSKRFCDISKSIPNVTEAMISKRLRELESSELVDRRVFTEGKLRIEYSLTEKGKAIHSVITRLQSLDFY